jgi:hypothetical protein
MPATARKPFQALFALAFAAGLSAQEPVDAVYRAATALGNGDSAAFIAAFDPATPGFARIRSDASELVRLADAQSTLRSAGDSGQAGSRVLLFDWQLRIADNDTAGGVTQRDARVTCRVSEHDGQWRIVQFEPRDFFRPPRVDGAWNVLESAAAALNNGSVGGFLSYFDKSMAGYNRLAAGVAALAGEGEVQSSIELIGNEGSDTVRAVEVDWTLQIISEDTQIRRGARQQHVKCRVELRQGHWRIMTADPVDFFSAISLAVKLTHQGIRRAVLLERNPERGTALRADVLDRRIHRAEARSVRIGQVEDHLGAADLAIRNVPHGARQRLAVFADMDFDELEAGVGVQVHGSIQVRQHFG